MRTGSVSGGGIAFLCLLSYLSLFFSLSLFFPVTAESAPIQAKGNVIKVEAEGYAPIVGNDKNRAKDEAKRSAYRDALEKALGAYVTGITQVENYQVVKDKVFSQTTGIVTAFDITREWTDKDGVFWLSAVCGVSTAALDGVLGPAVIDALGNPRVMVLIDERTGDKKSFLATTESETLRVFEKAGYLIVDPTQAGVLKDIDLEAARAENNPERLREIARDFQADVLIYGKAYASSFAQQRVSGVMIHGVRSTVQLKAVLANSAYQLSSETVEEKTKGTSTEDGAIKGFQVGADKAASGMINKIAYAMISGSAGGIPGRTVKIRLSNVTFGDAKAVKEALQGTKDVSGVYQRLFRNKNLELDVVSEKTAEDLASILSDLGYEIGDVTSATVEGSKGGL